MDWPMVVYLAGVFVFLVRLGIGMARVKALLRGMVSCAAPVTVGLLRPKVILPPDSSQWPQGKLDAVLAHEHEHARRRDPLWRFIAVLNRALF
jgi:beta-lactamase regulating signal transducer with metallopeptidase domain